MKSKINLAAITVCVCLATAVQADESSALVISESLAQLIEASNEEGNAESKQQLVEQAAILQPCHRWPHPCD